MPDDFGDSQVMFERQSESESGLPQTQPLQALEYEPPRPRRRRDMSIWLAIAAAFFMSVGVGFAIFGFMVSTRRVHDEVAAATGFGCASFTFGLCLAGLYWLRGSNSFRN